MKDVLSRAGKTFWQSFFAYMLTSLGAGVGSNDCDAIVHALAGIIVGSIAAGLSASYNGVIAPIFKKGGGNSVEGK